MTIIRPVAAQRIDAMLLASRGEQLEATASFARTPPRRAVMAPLVVGGPHAGAR